MTYSLILATFLGTMGLPHVVVRFYTNPDGRAARRTTLVVLGLLGLFYVLPPVYGALGRLYADELAASGRSDALVLELPRLMVGGPLGDLLSGLVTAGAFAAFLSTSSGLIDRGRRRAQPGRVRPGLRPPPAGVSAFRLGAVVAVVVPLLLALALPTSASPGRSAWRSPSPPRRSARCSCSASGGGGSPTSARSPGCSSGFLGSGSAVLWAMASRSTDGLGGAARAAGRLDGAARVRDDGRRQPAHAAPGAGPHAPLHGPAAHPGGSRARPRLDRSSCLDRPLDRFAAADPAVSPDAARRDACRACDPGTYGDAPSHPVTRRASTAHDDHTTTVRQHGTIPSTTSCTSRRSSASCKRRYRSFVFPATVAFLAWYLLYVLMSQLGHRLHEHQGRRQHQRRPGLRAAAVRLHVPASPSLYARYADQPARPAARDRAALRASTTQEEGRHELDQTLTTILFLAVVALTVGITFWASRQTKGAADYYAGGRSLHRLPERPGDLRRLHVGRVVPRHLRRHRARTATTASSTRSASWSPGWSRCCWSPSCCATPAATRWPTSSRTGCGSARCAPPPPRRPSSSRSSTCSRRWSAPARSSRCCSASTSEAVKNLTIVGVGAADDLLRHRRRHEGHHLGADRQGRAADDRHGADHRAGAGGVQLQPLRPARRRRRQQPARARRSSSRA